MDSHFMFDYSPERRRIILPENGFNGLYSNGKDIIDYTEYDTYKAADEARKVAGHFDNQNEWTQRRYARNSMQVLTENLDKPTDFVLFWAVEKDFCVKGGTAIAARLARLYKVPTFNLWNQNVLDEVCDTLGINTKPPTLDFLW
ncbi:FHA domain-containing protein [Escherichia phage UPEC03]|nr:FHA domain-containing protein [Escherichia phage UPEC03]